MTDSFGRIIWATFSRDSAVPFVCPENIEGRQQSRRYIIVAYHGLFESHIRYGIAVWEYAVHTHIECVLKMQKRALRTMFGLGW